MNINDVLRNKSGVLKRETWNGLAGLLVDFNFGDLLPELNENAQKGYDAIFGHLFEQIISERVGGEEIGRVMIKSGFYDGIQKVLVQYGRKPLSDENLRYYNSRFSDIGDGFKFLGPLRGSSKAAVEARKWGGRIEVSNIQDGIYCVQMSVRLPQPKTA